MDLTDRTSYARYAALLKAENPQVSLLINAAGFGKFCGTMEVPYEENLNMCDLNCQAVMAMSQLSVPYMPAGSRIINFASVAADQPIPYINVYGATKAFVLSFSRSLNVELKSRGIRVMAICPGWVKTEFFDHAFQTNGDNEVQYFNYVYEADECVATGLKDLYKSRKDYSIHGLPVKLQVLGVKLLPHSIIMNIWLNQQKKPLHNQGLTTK